MELLVGGTCSQDTSADACLEALGGGTVLVRWLWLLFPPVACAQVFQSQNFTLHTGSFVAASGRVQAAATP